MLEFCKSVLEFAKPKHSIFDFCMPSSIFFARYSGFFEHENVKVEHRLQNVAGCPPPKRQLHFIRGNLISKPVPPPYPPVPPPSHHISLLKEMYFLQVNSSTETPLLFSLILVVPTAFLPSWSLFSRRAAFYGFLPHSAAAFSPSF